MMERSSAGNSETDKEVYQAKTCKALTPYAIYDRDGDIASSQYINLSQHPYIMSYSLFKKKSTEKRGTLLKLSFSQTQFESLILGNAKVPDHGRGELR